MTTQTLPDARGQDRASIELIEVAPRDGLQNEQRPFSVDEKVALVRRLEAAGAQRIEVASFVNPRKVPQMADAEAVLARLGQRAAIHVGLVLNRRGVERALATHVDEIGAVCAASDAFAIANQGMPSSASIDEAVAIVGSAQVGGRRAQAAIAVAFGCPFSGPVDPGRVVDAARRLAAARPIEIVLADTIGCAVPAEVDGLVRAVGAAIAPIPVRAHFHDTRGTGIANVWAALSAGVTRIDAAAGGLGGCPFAPDAAGNVATEDVLYLLDRSGIAAGYDRAAIGTTATWLAALLDRPLPGRAGRAPDFPSRSPTHVS